MTQKRTHKQTPHQENDLQEKLKKAKKKKILRKIGLILAGVETLAAFIFVVLMFILNMLPIKYEAVVIVLLLLISAYVFIAQLTKSHYLGKAIAVLMTIVLIIGDLYIAQTLGMIDSVFGSKIKVDTVSVYVLKSDNAKTIEDAADYQFGCHSMLDKSHTEDTIQKINQKVSKEISLEKYSDLSEMVTSLYNGEVQAIILNSSYVQTLEESFPDFENDTKVIYSEKYETKIATSSNKKITKETFTIYLSGNDSWGSLTETGRSDVNILMVVNPTTRQILMVNTPRDYYVEVNSLTSGVGKDKLTHAGQFGVDASMATLSALYNDWPVDYYVKVNFSGVEGIVDALGGVTVDSDVAFTTSDDTSDIQYTFTKGSNTLSGHQALAFCRERQAFGNGDNQRGEDQMAVMKGIISKASSPSVLASYSSLMSSVSSLFATSLEDDDISSLVKMMLNDSSEWNVQSYAVTGTGSYGPSYFFGYSSLYVMEPDNETVTIASELMNKIKNGEIFDVEEYVVSK